MGGLVFPPSNKDKAHFKDTILAIEDKKGSCVLEMHRYLIALYPGENINDKTSVLFYLTGKYDKVSRQTTNCKMAIKMENRPDDLWSASLPNNTAGLVVRSENKNNAKIKARQLVAVDESGKTLLVITPFGNHFRLNPSGEAMMIERFDGTWRACWSTFPLKPRDVLGAPLVTANVTTPRTFIDILAWEHFVREYNAGRCQTAERVRLVVETEIERLVNLRGKNQGSLRVHLRNQAAWYVFNKLRNYEHVTAPFLTDGKPPSNGGVFLDLNGPDQIDLYYTQERFPFRSNMPSDFRPEAGGCPRAPQYISGTTATFSKNCTGADCRVPCLAPNPMACRDPTPGGLGQGMPLGFEGSTGPTPRVRCRMLLGKDAPPSQVLSAVNCSSADSAHECMGKTGGSAQANEKIRSEHKPRVLNTTELDTYMSSYCTKMKEFKPDDKDNDCPVDPVTQKRPLKCPNALRPGRNGEPGPADACRRWQRGSGADAAHSAYVSLCQVSENQAQPWCDCIAGSLPGGRFFELHEAASSVPFTTRQNEGCWFPPCGRNDYTLQRRSDVETDLGACQVSCVNVLNLSDSTDVTMTGISQQMTCSVGRETINVRPKTGTPQTQIGTGSGTSSTAPVPNNNHLIPTPPPNTPDTIAPISNDVAMPDAEHLVPNIQPPKPGPGPNPRPNPIPSPTPTPSPRPVPVPSPSPAPNPRPVPIPNPTGPTPSPRPLPTPNPTPIPNPYSGPGSGNNILGDSLILGMDRNKFYMALGASGVVIVLMGVSIYYLSKRGKRK